MEYVIHLLFVKITICFKQFILFIIIYLVINLFVVSLGMSRIFYSV